MAAGAAGSVLLLSLPISGCVSAVDDTSAFGFSDDGGSMQVAAAQSPASSEQPDDAAGPAGQTVASAVPSAVTPSAGTSSAATLDTANTANAATSRANDPARPAVAAYAGATVTQGDETGASNATQGGKSLFASLFARSNARTPIANAERGKGRRVVLKREGSPQVAEESALPGVNPDSLFEIGQRASANEDLLEDVQGSYQVASLSGLARLAPNGLMVQRDDVDTSCFPQELVGLLRTVERRYGKQVVVTSGYRSPSHNRRVNGAMRSQHMGCKAADIIVPDVDHLAVAAFVRSLPNRGGVGTYCHTQAIHVDVGPKRDWNWSCRRRG